MPLSHTDATMDVGRRDRRDFGRDRAKTLTWHRSKPLQRCKLKITCLCKLCTHVCICFGVFYNSEITQTLFLLERSAIL